ncbi:MAG: hypothetical protein ACE1ZQ_03030, partial [Ignavibacteriaceae bacterium]
KVFHLLQTDKDRIDLILKVYHEYDNASTAESHEICSRSHQCSTRFLGLVLCRVFFSVSLFRIITY